MQIVDIEKTFRQNIIEELTASLVNRTEPNFPDLIAKTETIRSSAAIARIKALLGRLIEEKARLDREIKLVPVDAPISTGDAEEMQEFNNLWHKSHDEYYTTLSV